MASIDIWNPARVSAEPAVLECHVTQGQAILLARGRDALVVAALGAAAEAGVWSVDAGRLVNRHCRDARVTTGLASDRRLQLHCDLGPRSQACYRDGAGEALLDALVAAGAAVDQVTSLARLWRVG